jgi:hypothetical protein
MALIVDITMTLDGYIAGPSPTLEPLLLGGGTRLFGDSGGRRPALELTRLIDSPSVTHLRYRVVR